MSTVVSTGATNSIRSLINKYENTQTDVPSSEPQMDVLNSKPITYIIMDEASFLIFCDTCCLTQETAFEKGYAQKNPYSAQIGGENSYMFDKDMFNKLINENKSVFRRA